MKRFLLIFLLIVISLCSCRRMRVASPLVIASVEIIDHQLGKYVVDFQCNGGYYMPYFYTDSLYHVGDTLIIQKR